MSFGSLISYLGACIGLGLGCSVSPCVFIKPTARFSFRFGGSFLLVYLESIMSNCTNCDFSIASLNTSSSLTLSIVYPKYYGFSGEFCINQDLSRTDGMFERINEHFGLIEISAYGADLIILFLASLCSESDDVRAYFDFMSDLFAIAISLGFIHSNPCAVVKSLLERADSHQLYSTLFANGGSCDE